MELTKEYEKVKKSQMELFEAKKMMLDNIRVIQHVPIEFLGRKSQDSYINGQLHDFETRIPIDPQNEEIKRIQEVREKFNSELMSMYPSLNFERLDEQLELRPKIVGEIGKIDRILPKLNSSKNIINQ